MPTRSTVGSPTPSTTFRLVCQLRDRLRVIVGESASYEWRSIDKAIRRVLRSAEQENWVPFPILPHPTRGLVTREPVHEFVDGESSCRRLPLDSPERLLAITEEIIAAGDKVSRLSGVPVEESAWPPLGWEDHYDRPVDGSPDAILEWLDRQISLLERTEDRVNRGNETPVANLGWFYSRMLRDAFRIAESLRKTGWTAAPAEPTERPNDLHCLLIEMRAVRSAFARRFAEPGRGHKSRRGRSPTPGEIEHVRRFLATHGRKLSTTTVCMRMKALGEGLSKSTTLKALRLLHGRGEYAGYKRPPRGN